MNIEQVREVNGILLLLLAGQQEEYIVHRVIPPW